MPYEEGHTRARDSYTKGHVLQKEEVEMERRAGNLSWGGKAQLRMGSGQEGNSALGRPTGES